MKGLKFIPLLLIYIISAMPTFADRTILFREDFEDEDASETVSESSIPFIPEGDGAADWDNSLWNPNGATVGAVELYTTDLSINTGKKYRIKLSTNKNPVLLGAEFSPSSSQYVMAEYDLLLTSIPGTNPGGEIFYSDGYDNLDGESSSSLAIHVKFGDDNQISDDSSGLSSAVYTAQPHDDDITTKDDSNEHEVRVLTSFTWAASTWYRVLVIADQINKTFDLKVTNLTDGSISYETGIPYNNSSAGDIKKIWFGVTANGPNNYLDNIVAYEDLSSISVSAPSIIINGDRFSAVTNSNPEIDVDFYDDSSLSTLQYSIDNGSNWFTFTTDGITLVSPSGNSYTSTVMIDDDDFDLLGEGENEILIKASDGTNIYESPWPYTIYKDTTGPEITINTPSATTVSSLNPVSVTLNDAESGVNSDTDTVTYSLSYTDGSDTYYWDGVSAWSTTITNFNISIASDVEAGVDALFTASETMPATSPGYDITLDITAKDSLYDITTDPYNISTAYRTFSIISGTPSITINNASVGPSSNWDDYPLGVDFDAVKTTGDLLTSVQYQIDSNTGTWSDLVDSTGSTANLISIETIDSSSLDVYIPETEFDALSDGSYNVYFRAYDGTNEAITDQSMTLVKDTSSPTVTFTYPSEADGGSFSELPPISGTAADASGGSGFSENSLFFSIYNSTKGNYWDGIDSWSSTEAWLSTTHEETSDDTSVTWVNNVTIPETVDFTDANDYVFSAKITDNAGNISTIVSKTLTYVNPDVYTWDGSESSDWEDPDNWDVNSVPDGSYLRVIIPDSGTVTYTATLSDNVSVNDLVIESGGVLNTSTYNLNVYGDWTNSGTFSMDATTPGTITFGGTTTFTEITPSSFRDVDISGDLTLASDLDIDGNLTISGSGSLDADGNPINVAGDWTNDGAFASNSNTVTFDGTTTLTDSSTAFNNIVLNTTGVVTLASTLDVDGDLTITAGTLDANGNDMTVAGDWYNSDIFTSNSNTVTFDGTAQSVTTNDQDFNNLTVSSTTSLDFTGILSAAGDVSLTSGITTLGSGVNTVTGNITGAGSLDASSGTSLNVDGDLGNTATALGSYTSAPITTVGGDWDITTFTHSSGTVTFDGAIQAITSNDQDFNNLTVSSTTSLDFTGILSADGDVSLTSGITTLDSGINTVTGDITGAGSLDASSATSLNVDGDLGNSTTALASYTASAITTVAGDWRVTTFSNSSGIVTFDGTSSTIYGSNTFYEFKSVTASNSLIFQEGETQTISIININASDSASIITLESTTNGNTWYIKNIDDTNDIIDYISVQDSSVDDSGSNIDAGDNSLNNENNDIDSVTVGNSYWIFKQTTISWVGSTSSSWEAATNWSPASVPTYYNDVVIPDVNPNFEPELQIDSYVKTLTIESSASLSVAGQKLYIDPLDLNLSDDLNIADGGTLSRTGDASETVTKNDSDSGTVEYTGTGTITVEEYTSDDYYNLKFTGSAPETSNAFSIVGDLTISDTATFSGQIEFSGTSSSISNLNGNDITFSDILLNSVDITGDVNLIFDSTTTLTTGVSSITTTGTNNITFNDNIVGSTYDLVLDSSDSINFNDSLVVTTSGVSISAVNDVLMNVNSKITAPSLQLITTSGSIGTAFQALFIDSDIISFISGTNIYITDSDDLTLGETTVDSNVNSDADLNGTLSITTDGDLTLSEDITNSGDASITFDSGTGATILGSNIYFTNVTGSDLKDLNFLSALELLGAFTIETTSPVTVDLDITFSDSINGGYGLILNAGLGYIDFNGLIGGTTPLVSLTINSASRVDFSGIGNASNGITGDLTVVTSTTDGVVLFEEDTYEIGNDLNITAGTTGGFYISMDSAGTYSTGGSLTVTNTDTYIYGTSSAENISFTSSSQSYGDVHISIPGKTLTWDSGVTANNIVFYDGDINFTGNTLTTTEDLVILGSGYKVNDDSDTNFDLFTYDNSYRSISGNSEAKTEILSEFYNGYDSSHSMTEGSYTTEFLDLSGSTLVVGSNFYNNGANMNSDNTGSWSLQIPDNDDATTSFAEAYNMSVYKSNANKTIAAVESVTATDSTGWETTRYAIDITTITTVYDDVIKVSLESGKLFENSNNEISTAVGSGLVEVDFNNQHISSSNLATYTDPECTISTDGNGDINTFYLQVDGSDSYRWNTDATGLIAGVGTDRGRDGVSAEVRATIPNLKLTKGSSTISYTLLDSNKNRLSSVEITETLDGAAPVITSILASKHDSGTSDPFDGHNYFEVTFSEDIIYNLDSGEVSTGFSENTRSSTTVFNSSGADLGWIEQNGAEVNVEGLFSYEGNYVSGSFDGTANTNAIFVDGSELNKLRIDVVAYYNGSSWPGYLGSISTDIDDYIKITNPSSNYIRNNFNDKLDDLRDANTDADIITQLTSIEKSATVYGNSDIYDTAGNTLEGSSDNSYGAYYKTMTISGLDGADPTGWDVFPPYFSKQVLEDGTTTDVYEIYFLDQRISEGDRIVDNIAFHILDDHAMQPFWVSWTGWSSGTTDVDIRPDPIGGIRDDLFMGNTTAFEIGLLDDASKTNTPITGMLTGVDTYMLRTVESGSFEIDEVDDNYFSIQINQSENWLLNNQMSLEYDASIGKITDLAGNLMPNSNDSLDAFQWIPPEILISLGVVDSNSLYIQFSKEVYSNDPSVSEREGIDKDAFSLDSVDGNLITAISALKGDDATDTAGKKEFFLTLNDPITANDLVNGKIQINTDSVYDLYGSSADNDLRRVSDLGIGVVSPTYASDSLHQDDRLVEGEGSLRDFDGSGRLLPEDVIIAAEIQGDDNQDYPLTLIYDIDTDLSEAIDYDETDSLFNNELWLPESLQGTYIFDNLDLREIESSGLDGDNHLFSIDNDDYELAENGIFQFIYKLEADEDLYCVYIPSGGSTLTDLKPWEFYFDGLKTQRGGVTIINNVINPLQSQSTELFVEQDSPGMSTISIFSIDGTLIKTLQKGRLSAGSYRYIWDGTNKGGRTVARGIYFIKVIAPDINESRKVLVVK